MIEFVYLLNNLVCGVGDLLLDPDRCVLDLELEVLVDGQLPTDFCFQLE
jgi:hypothetical protein